MRIWLIVGLGVLTCAVSGSTAAMSAPAGWPRYQHPLATTYRTAHDDGNTEAKRLAAYPDLAVRDGARLKIFHAGTLIATVASCPKIATRTCPNFAFVGPVTALSPTSHKPETYAQVVELYDETSNYLIPLENGKQIKTDGEASGSPDGHWLASGGDRVDELNGNQNLTIRDMTGGKPDIVFGPSCFPNQWTGPAAFTALCESLDSVGEVEFEAVASQTASGQWTLATTRILAYDPSQKPAAAPDTHRIFNGKPKGSGWPPALPQ